MVIGGNINFANGSGFSTYNLAGGLLDLTGGELNTRSGTAVFNFTGGTLMNVGQSDLAIVQDGGILSPGGPTGTIAITGQYALNAGALHTEIAAAAFDAVSASGTVTLGGGAETPVIDVDLLGGHVPAIGEFFDIVVAANGITNADLTGVAFDFSDAQTGAHWWREIVSLGGSAEALRLTVSPEPTTLTLLALGGLGLLARRRRRR